MIRCCALIVIFASLTAANTKVAVLEIGAKGVIQRSTSTSKEATVAGVQTFWASLHDNNSRRALVSKDIPIVSDLFSKPDVGIAISLVGGVDLSIMPEASRMLGGQAVGVIQVPGLQGRQLLENVAKSSTWKEAVSSALTSSSMQAFTIDVKDDASSADAELSRMVASLKEEATSRGKSIVLYLVVEDDEDHSRRQLMERDLNTLGDNYYASLSANYTSSSGGFYGYGFEDSNGDFIVMSKTIFQIQYFQIVLWTAIGLASALIFCFSLMVGMPLMADTLLFGESSKMMGD
jgi:hypothetical protein